MYKWIMSQDLKIHSVFYKTPPSGLTSGTGIIVDSPVYSVCLPVPSLPGVDLTVYLKDTVQSSSKGLLQIMK